MKVKILHYPKNWLDLIYFAGRCCYGKESALKGATKRSKENFSVRLVKNRHESVLEHVNASVCFIGVSRAFMSQITRHRLASFSVKSQHYADYSGAGFYRYKEHKKVFDLLEGEYRSLLKSGEPKHEARYVLPEASLTNIFMTANVREWRHVLKLRCSTRNIPEMRSVMLETLKRLHGIMPCLFEDLVAEYVRIH